MTTMDDAVQQLNDATDEVARDLETLRTELTGSDAAAAARLVPAIERLRALGADPQNPFPA